MRYNVYRFKCLNQQTGGLMRKTAATDEMVQDTLQSFKSMTKIFAVLADENRQLIIAELGQYDQLNVKELDERIPLSRPAISHHLKNLKLAGIVDCQKKGTENYYYLTIKTTIEELRTLMDKIENICYLI